MLHTLKEKLALLSENHRRALAANMDEIMYTTTGDVGIYYDDSGMHPFQHDRTVWEVVVSVL